LEGKLSQDNLKIILEGVSCARSTCTLKQRKVTFNCLVKLGVTPESIREHCEFFENVLKLYGKEEAHCARHFLSYIQGLYPRIDHAQGEDPHELL